MRVCMTAVMMGDIGAVTVVQEAHTRLLLRSGVLSPETMVNSPFIKNPEGVQGDVYIDDLILMAIGSLCSPPQSLIEALQLADKVYDEENLVTKSTKSIAPTKTTDAWGALVNGHSGIVRFSGSRCAALTAATLCGLERGLNRREMQQILGVWVFA